MRRFHFEGHYGGLEAWVQVEVIGVGLKCVVGVLRMPRFGRVGLRSDLGSSATGSMFGFEIVVNSILWLFVSWCHFSIEILNWLFFFLASFCFNFLLYLLG